MFSPFSQTYKHGGGELGFEILACEALSVASEKHNFAGKRERKIILSCPVNKAVIAPCENKVEQILILRKAHEIAF